MGKSVKNVYVVTNLLLYILIHDATCISYNGTWWFCQENRHSVSGVDKPVYVQTQVKG